MHYTTIIIQPHISNLYTVKINQILLFNDNIAATAMLHSSSAVI